MELRHSKTLHVRVYVCVDIGIFIHTLLIMAEISFSNASGALESFFNITILLGTDLIRVLKPAKYNHMWKSSVHIFVALGKEGN